MVPGFGVAGRATARGFMPAKHVPSDDFDVDVHLDSAGHRFGAMGRGGARRHVLGVGESVETLREYEDEGLEVR